LDFQKTSPENFFYSRVCGLQKIKPDDIEVKTWQDRSRSSLKCQEDFKEAKGRLATLKEE